MKKIHFFLFCDKHSSLFRFLGEIKIDHWSLAGGCEGVDEGGEGGADGRHGGVEEDQGEDVSPGIKLIIIFHLYQTSLAK